MGTAAAAQPVKLIVFDWGGVIEYHGPKDCCFLQAIRRLMTLQGFYPTSIDAVENFISTMHRSGILIKHTDAELTSLVKQIYKTLGRTWYDGAAQDFRRAYTTAFECMPYVLGAVDMAKAGVRMGNVKLGILSDLAAWDISRLDRQVEPSQFDYTWFSFKTGRTKKDEVTYNVVEREAGVLPQNILYFDNNAGNIQRAQQRGWQAHLVTCNQVKLMQTLITEFLGV